MASRNSQCWRCHVCHVALNGLFKFFGVPRRIIAYRGTGFTSELFKSFCEERNIVLMNVAVQTPRGNGQIERYNKTIMPALLKISEPTEWHTKLKEVQMSLNWSIQSSTKKCLSEIFFGFKLCNKNDPIRLALEEEQLIRGYENQRDNIRTETVENIRRAQERNQTQYNKGRRPLYQFSKGQLVAIKTVAPPTDRAPKMAAKFIDPYYIKAVR